MSCLCCGKNICKNASNPSEEPLFPKTAEATRKPAPGNPWAQSASTLPAKPPEAKKATTVLDTIIKMTKEAEALELQGKGAGHVRTAIATLQDSVLEKNIPIDTSDVFKDKNKEKKSSGCCVM